MICCLETPFTDSKSSYYSQVATDEKLLPDEHQKQGAGGTSLYPGLRRTPHGPPAAAVPTNINSNTENSELIAVTVPPGVLPGQEIHVRRPDGNGLVEAVVPSGMKEGSVFHVKAPPPSQPNQPLVTNTSAPPQGDFANCLNEDMNPPPPSNNTRNHPPPPTTTRTTTTTTTTTNFMTPKARPGQALVRVQVPPGMKPGTTILVAIPNQPGRQVQAQIPPNASEFLVAYDNDDVPTATKERGHQGTSNSTSDGGDAILPIIGGIATGVAAVMAYEHYS